MIKIYASGLEKTGQNSIFSCRSVSQEKAGRLKEGRCSRSLVGRKNQLVEYFVPGDRESIGGSFEGKDADYLGQCTAGDRKMMDGAFFSVANPQAGRIFNDFRLEQMIDTAVFIGIRRVGMILGLLTMSRIEADKLIVMMVRKDSECQQDHAGQIER